MCVYVCVCIYAMSAGMKSIRIKYEMCVEYVYALCTQHQLEILKRQLRVKLTVCIDDSADFGECDIAHFTHIDCTLHIYSYISGRAWSSLLSSSRYASVVQCVSFDRS